MWSNRPGPRTKSPMRASISSSMRRYPSRSRTRNRTRPSGLPCTATRLSNSPRVNNYHVSQNLDTDAVVARKFDLYRHIWQECHHPGPMPRVFLQRQVHVAETDAKAHEEVRQFLASPAGGAVRVGGGPIAQTAHRLGYAHPRHGTRQ